MGLVLLMIIGISMWVLIKFGPSQEQRAYQEMMSYRKMSNAQLRYFVNDLNNSAEERAEARNVLRYRK